MTRAAGRREGAWLARSRCNGRRAWSSLWVHRPARSAPRGPEIDQDRLAGLCHFLPLELVQQHGFLPFSTLILHPRWRHARCHRRAIKRLRRARENRMLTLSIFMVLFAQAEGLGPGDHTRTLTVDDPKRTYLVTSRSPTTARRRSRWSSCSTAAAAMRRR